MSYVSGFMLGASIGKAIHSMLSGQKGGMEGMGRQQVAPKAAPQVQAPAVPAFTCVFAIKGRRRYRAAGLVGNQQLATLLQNKLSRLSAIQLVQFNVLTGSILIASSSERVLDELEEFFRTRLFPDTGEQIAQEINAVRKVEKEVESVYSDTNHILDLRSLISMVFIIRGVYKTVMLGQRPSGPQMLWWAAALLGRRG